MGIAIILIAAIAIGVYFFVIKNKAEAPEELTLVEQKYYDPAVAEAQKVETEAKAEISAVEAEPAKVEAEVVSEIKKF